jgi:hypothetical protein
MDWWPSSISHHPSSIAVRSHYGALSLQRVPSQRSYCFVRLKLPPGNGGAHGLELMA